MKRPPDWTLTPRREPRYPSAPAHAPVDCAGQPVHFVISSLGWTRAACGVRSVYQRLNTRYPGCVTCPDCLEAMNPVSPASSQQPPCGSPAGGASLSAGLAYDSAKKPATNALPPLVVDVPVSAQVEAGIFYGEAHGG